MIPLHYEVKLAGSKGRNKICPAMSLYNNTPDFKNKQINLQK